MPISAEQESAFQSGTLGLSTGDFQLTILVVFFGCIYLWSAWVIYTQWVSWSNRKINFYAFLSKSIRSVLVTLFISFLLF